MLFGAAFSQIGPSSPENFSLAWLSLAPSLALACHTNTRLTCCTQTQINMYIPMSKMQKQLYSSILKKDVDAINGKVSGV